MRVFGWALFATTCVMFVLQGLFLAASASPLISYDVLVDQAFPLVGIGAVIGAGVGALIVNRYPRSLIGWLFLVGQLGNAIGLACQAFGLLVDEGIIDAPLAGRTAVYLTELFDVTYTISILAVIFMISPDGHLLSKRWRVAIGVPIAALAMRVAVLVLEPASDFMPGTIVVYSEAEMVLLYTSFSTLLVAVLLGAVALGLRMRRSTAEQRRQLRWVFASAAILAVIFTIFAFSDLWFDPPPVFLIEALYLAYIFVSVSVGVAILKYRLYDIDVILSRAIALGVLAVFVTVGYIAVVVTIGGVLAAIGTPGSALFWPSLVATAVVAVAFQPLRRHVLRLADQLVYGSRAAPYEALASLSRRLADSPSPAALPGRVAEATGRAVGASGIVVTIGSPEPGSTVLSATWADAGAGADSETAPDPTVLLTVRDVGERVGTIAVTMPPGRGLRTFERDLLDDVAAQAGVAFRNALLEAELAARVAQGEAASAELEASRRRLVDVEDDAREALAAAIRRDVVPHLSAVESELSAADHPKQNEHAQDGQASRPDRAMQAGHDAQPVTATAPGERLERMIASTERALEALRVVCRGVFPALLERRGLAPALSAQLDATHRQAELRVDASAQPRLDRSAEAAAYVFCTEVAPRHLPSVITLRVDDGTLVATVSGDGRWTPEVGYADRGGDGSAVGAWQHARDRVAALDGRIRVRREDGTSLTVTAVIPLPDQPAEAPTILSQISSSRSGPKADLGT